MPPSAANESDPPMPPRTPHRRLDAEAFASELLDEMQADRKERTQQFVVFRKEIIDELRAARKAQGWRDIFFGTGAFLLVLVLAYGILQKQGVDVKANADAVVSVGKLLPGTGTTTTTTTTTPPTTTETVTAPATPGEGE